MLIGRKSPFHSIQHLKDVCYLHSTIEPRTGDPEVSRSWSFIESFILFFFLNACFLFCFLYDALHLRPKYQVDVMPSHLL